MTSMKEIEEDRNKWKDFSCSWIWGTNIVKMSVLLKVIYRFSVICIHIPAAVFTETEQSENSYRTMKDPE